MKDIREIVGSPSIETTGVIRIDGGKEYNAHIRIDFEHGHLTFSPLSSAPVFKFEPELESPQIIECILLPAHFTPTKYASTLDGYTYIHLFQPVLDMDSRRFAGYLIRYKFLYGRYAPRINPSEAHINKVELTFPHIKALIGAHSKFPILMTGREPITIPDTESAVCSWTSEEQTTYIVLKRCVKVSSKIGTSGASITYYNDVSAHIEISGAGLSADETFITNYIMPLTYLVSILAKSYVEIDEPTLIFEDPNNYPHRIDYFNLLPASAQETESPPIIRRSLYNAFLQKEATERFFSESRASEFVLAKIRNALSQESSIQDTFVSLVAAYENLGRQHFGITGQNVLMRSLQKVFDDTKHYIDWNYDVVHDDILNRIARTRHGYAHSDIAKLDPFVVSQVSRVQSALLHILVLYILLRAGFTTDFIGGSVWGVPPALLRYV